MYNEDFDEKMLAVSMKRTAALAVTLMVMVILFLVAWSILDPASFQAAQGVGGGY